MWIKRSKTLIKILIPVIVLIGILGCTPSATQPKGWAGGVITGNHLFFGSMDGKLVSIDISSGATLWSAQLTGPQSSGGGFGCAAPSATVAIYSTPAVSGDLAYVGGYAQSGNQSSGKVYAYTTGEGALRWVYPRDRYLSGPIVGGLVVSQGKLYFGAADGNVYALDAVTGDFIADFQTGEKIWSTPLIDGDTLYIGSSDKKLYVLDAATLKPTKWQEFETGGAIIATPLVYKGAVYVGSFDRTFYAIDATTGSLKWKFLAEKPFWAQPIAYNDVIYAPCLDNKVYVLNAATGTEVAPPSDLGSPISSSPVLVGNKIVVTSDEGKLYSLDTVTNKISLIADLQEGVNAPLSVDGTKVYIHTNNNSLYRVDVGTGVREQLYPK